MSGGVPCHCEERFTPIADRQWAVIDRYCNYSAFNGYSWAPSDYSSVMCLLCNGIWRTKAKYVELLRDATDKDLGLDPSKVTNPGDSQ